MSKPTLVADWRNTKLIFSDGLLFNGQTQVGTISSSSIGSDVVAHTAFFIDDTIDFMEYTNGCPQVNAVNPGVYNKYKIPSCLCNGIGRTTNINYTIEIQHGITVTKGAIYFSLSSVQNVVPPLTVHG
jgi:hypothetical protein